MFLGVLFTPKSPFPSRSHSVRSSSSFSPGSDDNMQWNTTELCMLRQRRELRFEYHSPELLIMLFTVPSDIDFAQSLGHHEPPDYVFLHLSSPRKTPFIYTHGQAQYYRGSYLLNAENTRGDTITLLLLPHVTMQMRLFSTRQQC